MYMVIILIVRSGQTFFKHSRVGSTIRRVGSKKETRGKLCVNPRPPPFKFAANTWIAFVARSLQLCANFIRIRQHNIMRCFLEQDDSMLLSADRRSRETEVEKEALLEKNRLQAADRRARVAQKEKEACLEKIAFKAPIDVWIKMLTKDQHQM